MTAHNNAAVARFRNFGQEKMRLAISHIFSYLFVDTRIRSGCLYKSSLLARRKLPQSGQGTLQLLGTFVLCSACIDHIFTIFMHRSSLKASEAVVHTCLPSTGALPVYRQRGCDLRRGCRNAVHNDRHLLERRCRSAYIRCSASETDTSPLTASLPDLPPLTGDTSRHGVVLASIIDDLMHLQGEGKSLEEITWCR